MGFPKGLPWVAHGLSNVHASTWEFTEVGADGGATEVAAPQSGRCRLALQWYSMGLHLISLGLENLGENPGEIPVSYHLIVFCCGKQEV